MSRSDFVNFFPLLGGNGFMDFFEDKGLSEEDGFMFFARAFIFALEANCHPATVGERLHDRFPLAGLHVGAFEELFKL
jgi:hypothetical protein